MKKWTVLFLTVVMVISLAACGSKEKDGANGGNSKPEQTTNKGAGGNTTGNSEKQTNAGNKEATGAVPTVEELIEKTAKAGAELKSFSMDSTVNQNIVVEQGGQKQEQKVDMKMKSDFVKEPLQMFQEIQMATPQGDQTIKQYITEDGIFTETNGAWVKLPNEMKDQMIASMQASMEPEKQLEQFKSIANDTKIVEEGDNYVLTAELSGDNVKELAKELMGQTGGANEQVAAMMESMNIKSIKIVSGVNKETFLPTRSDVNMSMEMEQEGQKVTLDMVMTSAISKHNEVAEIKVPKEALDAPAAQ
ncbi:DUF6612 family protein [Paenibacillus sp. GCM10027626]|uniref:DUF6612 family protein n=1 Tax=Paenibacillus sp. GCM10027626 TaxID=3273411 RepID=UPI0036335612